jgi:excisionase family DNA binding protein
MPPARNRGAGPVARLLGSRRLAVPQLCRTSTRGATYHLDCEGYVEGRQRATMSAMQVDAFLTERQLAARWRVSVRTIQRMVRDGQLGSTAIRHSPRFSVSAVEAYEARAGATLMQARHGYTPGPCDHIHNQDRGTRSALTALR